MVDSPLKPEYNRKNAILDASKKPIERSPSMNIQVNRDSKVPLYIQIKNRIKEMIFEGNLPSNYIMPAERKLAEQLGVNRTTILNAYRELKEEGLLDSHVGQGTIVLAAKESGMPVAKQTVFPLSWSHIMSEQGSKANDSAISGIMEMSSDEKMISFSAGMASPEFYPLDDLISSQKLFESFHQLPLQHTPVEGLWSLRENILKLVERIDIKAHSEEIMVLSGSQQGLDLVARTFLDPSDVVIVEEPTYIGALQVFQAVGARVIGVPMSEGGMRMDILEALIIKQRPKLIYTIPTFHNPTGTVMDLSHRTKLLDLCYTYGVPIVEDDAYGFLRMEGQEIPTLKALDTHEFVIYLNTFSKCLFPGLRLGYVIAAKEVIKRFIQKKQLMDLHANTLGQWMLSHYLLEGHLEKQLIKTIPQYKERRDAMLGALAKYAPKDVQWNLPEGGFYIWCELPKEVDVKHLLMKSAERGVVFVPGYIFYTGAQDSSCIRLNFTKHGTTDIDRGIHIIMNCLEEIRNKSKHMVQQSADNNPLF